MRVLYSVAILLLASAPSVVAGPICLPPTPTLAEAIANGDVALAVEWTSTTEDDADSDQKGETEFRIVHVIRDDTGEYRTGGFIRLPGHRAGAREDHFLLVGRTHPMLTWFSPRQFSPAAIEYVLQAPSPEIDVRERLTFFATFLEHPDPIIAEDAFAEVDDAEYKNVAEVAEALEVEKLRHWIADRETNPLRLGLYCLMLAQSGNAQDAEFLKRKILQPSEEYRIWLEGMISGYLLLTGEDGLPEIEDRMFHDPDSEFYETYAAMQSLRFMWNQTDGVIPRERVRESMRILLDRPNLADLVITDLARWQDWSVAERLMQLYGSGEFDIPAIKRAIVRYFLRAEHATGEGSNTSGPEHVLIAKAYLAELRDSDPVTVKQAERFFFPPRP